MSKTNIEWCDYSINPVKGICPVGCSYCFAKKLYKRFKWNPEIRMEPDWQETLPKRPSKVFVGSTMELFGDWVDWEVWESIEQYINTYPQHTFIFLTKRPENIVKHVFPKNCWVGLSVDGTENAPLRRIYNGLSDAKATVKFISFEPLLASVNLDYRDLMWTGINWIIIGQQTPISQKTCPEYSWIENIVTAADTAGVPVFIKDNLNACAIGDYPNLVDKCGRLRQEFPKSA